MAALKTHTMSSFLSVIMPVQNGERFVAAALESVRGQHNEGIELVFVNNGSTDRTLEIVSDFVKLLPIRLITPRRIGDWMAGANLGLREATGEWACFLCHDDLWLPGRIARLRGEMEKAEGALVLHNAVFVGPDGQRLGPWTCPLPEGVVPPDRFIERLLVQNFIAGPSPVFRRRTAIDSGGLDEALWYAADWDLWLRLGAMGPIRFIADTLGAFRVHPASQTVTHPLRPGEWEQQLTAVFLRHFPRWNATGKRRARVEEAAMASIAVNAALAATSRGEPLRWKGPLLKLLALGPSGWHRYVRDSRIVERVGSRLKLRRSLIGTLHRKVVSTSR
jgi:glycosyltransferase involved in cell wall biosynthesis